jgi:hypothetical protein
MTIKHMDPTPMDRSQSAGQPGLTGSVQQASLVAQRCLQCLRWLLCCLAVMVFGSAHALTWTSTSVTSSPQQGYVNQSITLTATVSPNAATATLSGGTATLTKSFSTTGSHTLTAVYAGDSTYAGSTSGQYSQTINSLVQTNLQLNVPSSTANVGQTFALTANVSPSAPAGTITFKDGNTTLAIGGGWCEQRARIAESGNVQNLSTQPSPRLDAVIRQKYPA